MARFLLVHGGAHGAWCWTKLTPLLRNMGHEAVAIDLPGSGEDDTPLSDVTLASCADAVVRAARAMGGENIILVGHSMGGLSISAAAEQAPECFSKLIFLTALMLRDGESVAANIDMGIPAQLTEDGLASLVPAELAVDLFYGDCAAEDVAFAMPRWRPQAIAPLITSIRLTDARFGRVPRAYIECALDRALSLDLQRSLMRRAPVAEVRTLEASHSPFFSMPDQLAEVLHDLA